MLDCLSIDGARQMGDWISGARAARQASAMQAEASGGRGASEVMSSSLYGRRGDAGPSGGGPSRNLELEERMKSIASSESIDPNDSLDLDDITPTLARSGAMAPAGFWEPEIPYGEHASASGRSASSAGVTGIEGVDESHQGPFSLTLNLVDPGQVTLELTKTALPIFKRSRTGLQTMVQTDSFIIVTTVPKSGFVSKGQRVVSRVPTRMEQPVELSPKSQTVDEKMQVDIEQTPFAQTQPGSTPVKPRTTLLSHPTGLARTMTISPLPNIEMPSIPSTQMTPTDEIMALDLAEAGEGQASRPLYFSSDGTVSRPRGPLLNGVDERGKPLDVHVLLATTDWSKTGLGARETWPQSLKTIGESVAKI